MSVSFLVVPFDSTIPDFVKWLENHGIAVPDEHGRYPTMDELINVLETIVDYPVFCGRVTENLWETSIGEPYTSTYAHFLGTIEDDGTFHFNFEKGSTETTMLEVLKRLAQKCGPLVLADDSTATPVLVTSNTIVEVALEEWYQRQRTTNN
jgi:hypothetical protein